MKDQHRVQLIMMECINSIEDYFEYRYRSVEDKEVVMRHIDHLTERLRDYEVQDMVEGVKSDTPDTEHLNSSSNNKARLEESINQHENGESRGMEEHLRGERGEFIEDLCDRLDMADPVLYHELCEEDTSVEELIKIAEERLRELS
jgi:hypothetical protein